jgi:hypothetical protein
LKNLAIFRILDCTSILAKAAEKSQNHLLHYLYIYMIHSLLIFYNFLHSNYSFLGFMDKCQYLNVSTFAGVLHILRTSIWQTALLLLFSINMIAC